MLDDWSPKFYFQKSLEERGCIYDHVYLMWDTNTYVQTLYITCVSDCVEDIDAQKVFGYALFKDDKSTSLAYPLEKFTRDVAGRSFHNGRFVQRMREKAATVPK